MKSHILLENNPLVQWNLTKKVIFASRCYTHFPFTTSLVSSLNSAWKFCFVPPLTGLFSREWPKYPHIITSSQMKSWNFLHNLCNKIIFVIYRCFSPEMKCISLLAWRYYTVCFNLPSDNSCGLKTAGVCLQSQSASAAIHLPGLIHVFGWPGKVHKAGTTWQASYTGGINTEHIGLGARRLHNNDPGLKELYEQVLCTDIFINPISSYSWYKEISTQHTNSVARSKLKARARTHTHTESQIPESQVQFAGRLFRSQLFCLYFYNIMGVVGHFRKQW